MNVSILFTTLLVFQGSTKGFEIELKTQQLQSTLTDVYFGVGLLFSIYIVP